MQTVPAYNRDCCNVRMLDHTLTNLHVWICFAVRPHVAVGKDCIDCHAHVHVLSGSYFAHQIGSPACDCGCANEAA